MTQFMEWFEESLDSLIAQLRLSAIKSGHDIQQEVVWSEEYCPHCKEPGFDLVFLQGSRAGMFVSAFYDEPRNAFVYYWLCGHCTKRFNRTSKKWKRRMEMAIQIEILSVL